MKNFSHYKSPITNTSPTGVWGLADVHRYITTSEVALKNTEELRCIKDEQKHREFKAKQFDCVTFSGVFTKRCADGLIEHSGLIVLDIDHVGEKVNELKGLFIIDQMLQPLMVFTSPSGDGLKVVVEIDLEKADHLTWFYALKGYVSEIYGISIDEKCKDVGRACFLPYDRECYFRDNMVENAINVEEWAARGGLPQKNYETDNVAVTTTAATSVNHEETCQDVELLLKQLEERQMDITSDYGDWIKLGFAFANFCGEQGREWFHRVSQFHPTYTREEADKKFTSLLRNERGDVTINSFFHLCKEAGVTLSPISPNPQALSLEVAEQEDSSILLNINNLDDNNNTKDSTESQWVNGDCGEMSHEIVADPDFFSPLLINKQLPMIFRDVIDYYDYNKEKDIAFMTLVAMLGAPLSNIHYVHGDRAFYPSFFLMVVAASGDGKGVLEQTKSILSPLSRQLQEKYNEEYLEFKRKWAQWDATGKKNGEPQPEPPAQPAAIIQAGTTTAGFYTTLEANGGWAVVNESEAYKMVEEQKNSWSQINSIIRQALSNETISTKRATAGLSHSIDNPRIGIAMGAQQNVPKLLYPSAVLGDVQRITFLDISKRERVLINKFIRSEKPLVADFYYQLGVNYLDLYNQMSSRKTPVEFVCTPEQKAKLFDFQQHTFNTFGECFGEVLDGKIVRTPNEMHNIILLLTLLYRYEERLAAGKPVFEEYEQTLLADERAVDICLSIMPTLMKHTASVWQKNKWSEPVNTPTLMAQLSHDQQLLYDNLPKTFTKAQWDEKSKELNIPLKTSEKWLSPFCIKSQILMKIGHGKYMKIVTKSVA